MDAFKKVIFLAILKDFLFSNYLVINLKKTKNYETIRLKNNHLQSF